MHVGVTHVEQAVVEVLAIGGERRLAGAKAASDRETEVEKRHDEHRERQQDRDERGQEVGGVDVRSIDDLGVDLPRDEDGGGGHEEPDEQCTGITHEQLGGVEVERQEADARADQHRGGERGEVEVFGLCLQLEQVGVDEEDAVGDERDPGDETVEAVDEVDGVHDEHHREHGDDQRDVGRDDRLAADRQGLQLHALPGEHARGDDLAGELGDPVQIPDVVGDADQHDDQSRPEDAEHLARVGEDEAELGHLGCHAEGDDHAEEHRHATQPRSRAGVNVALTDLRVQPVLGGQLPDENREPVGHDGGDAGDERVEDYSHRSAPTRARMSSDGMAPSRTMRSLPSGRARAMASTMVEAMVPASPPSR